MLAVAFLLLVLPVGVALFQAAAQLRQLASETDQLVRQGVSLASQTQSLSRLLSSFERSTNLYLLLGDPRVLEASQSTQQQILEAADQLAALPLESGGSAWLTDLRHAVAGSVEIITLPPPADVDRTEMLRGSLAAIEAAANGLADAANATLDAQLKSLETRAQETRQKLFLWLAALIPASVALGALFVIGVLRPLRRIDRAITELGGGSFVRPIAIRGPTDIEALGRQLEWLRVRLLELGEEKNRFLRHMSHELKTPLANLREGTDLLLDDAVGPLDEGQREVAGILRDNTIRLQRLIENLLSYSAWQSSASQLDVGRFALGSLVRTVIDAQRLPLSAREIHVDVDVGDVVLKGDRRKLKLVFDNLLSNALKFTPRGGTIHVHGRREGHLVVIDFADTGPGIPEHERERIFEDFYTGAAPHSGSLKGTGIGLSIVREFVQAHGGRVEIVSGRFPGAHFRIHLPLEPPQEGPREGHAA